jgi:Fur family transcriptional regulator, zinc uptake regulator
MDTHEYPFPAPGHSTARCRARTLRRAEVLCLERGLRLTPRRRQVLGILAGRHRCLGAYDILERMAGAGRRPPPAAVYRSLDFLIRLGLVHRLAGRNAYIACTRAPHGDEAQFWICQRCQLVAETTSAEIAAAVPNLARDLGFRPATVDVAIEGECPACRGR